MNRLNILITILFMVYETMSADFHAPEFSFTHFTTDNGFPSNRIRDIEQDNEGFMWFATDAGLVRYDGTATRVFTPYADSRPAGEIFIMSLCKTDSGLLVGTDQNLYVYDSDKERMELPLLKYSDNVKDKVAGVFLDIIVDSTGCIWLSVEGKGIFRISSAGVVEAFFSFRNLQNFIGKLYVDNNDTVWCVVNNVGEGSVMRFDRNAGRFVPFQIIIDDHATPLRALAITSDSQGNFWLGTWENGLVKFNGRTGEGHIVKSLDPSSVWHIHSVTQFTPTTLLIGSDSGLTIIDINTEEWKRYEEDELNPNSINDRFIYPITIDSDGGLWVGTFYRGVNYQSRDSKRFQKWRHSRFANSVCGNVVIRLCEDNGGNIWIGTADGGLCRLNPETGLFKNVPLTGSNTTDNINALCSDGDKLWVGTYTKGIGVLDIATCKWNNIPVENNDGRCSCYAICKDSKGRIWAGATEHLIKYNPERNVFEIVRNLNAWIIDIDEDHDGTLWVSTQGNGLFTYNPDSNDWTIYNATGAPGGLPHNHINNVKIDDNGKVYVSTVYGVHEFDRRDNTFKKIDMGIPGLASHSLELSGNELWTGTAFGLIQRSDDGTTRVYTTSDGIADNQFVPGASLLTSDGKIYYGTVNGLCMVDPLEARNKAAAPKVMFTGLDIINSPVPVGDRRLPSSLNSIDKLVLTHADHTFSIYFSALNYSNPAGSSYKYRLEGFDKTWIEAGKESRATYSNIPPGNYTLRVKASNSDGIWNEEGVALKIEVKPAWYASTIMKIIYALAALALIYLAVRYLVWRMERNHKKELDRISINKEKEMFRSKLNFFTVVAHEIRTPVSLIIGPLEKVLESKEKFTPSVNEDLNVINRNANRLLSLVNQLLDFKKVEDNSLQVGFRTVDIVPLMENVTDRFRPSVEHKGGTLTVSMPENFSADVDNEAVTKLVSNLLNNARKFTKDEIRVECRPLPDGKNFMISVSDNGIGISKENRDKVFKPFFQVHDNINESKGGTGLGLSIVKSVVDAHHGSIELDSTPGKGTKFTVTLPLHQDNIIPDEMISPENALPQSAHAEICEGKENTATKPTLLMVDDNEEMARFIASNFNSVYDVVTAGNGREALEALKSHQVSLIICDWMMPVMDGVEFLKAVRGDKNYCHTPFVMLTAKTDNLSKIETMRSGADAYVEKPFSISFLEARIANLLNIRKMLRQKYSDSPLEPIEAIAPTPLDNELLKKLTKIIEDNFSNPGLNVDFLVEQIGISRSGLYSKIKTLADISPNELIQITRLKKAAALLKEGNHRINEVSYMVGFNSTSYFSRCFQKQFGMKPNEFQSAPDRQK